MKIDSGGKKIVMVFDFDGTITEKDVFDALFTRYADPEWWEANRAYHEDKLTLKEAYLKMARYFRGTGEELQAFLRQNARERKGFKELLNRLHIHRIQPMIVSNGFDIYILSLLRFWRIDYHQIDILCHHAEIIDTRFIPSFREHGKLKHSHCLIGKAEIIQDLKDKGNFVCFAGDGYSDTPAAAVADLVFARRILADYCRENRIDYVYFSDFVDVIDYLFNHEKV